MSTTLPAAIRTATNAFSGNVAYALADLSTGERYTEGAERWMPTASAIKLPILTAFHSLVASGGADWDETVEVDDNRRCAGSGILTHLSLPRPMSYRDLAWLMICVSDNLATNVILERIGLARVNQLITDCVGPGLVVDKPAGHHAAGEPPRSMGRATPAALLRYLENLAAHRYPGSAETIAVAGQQQSHGGIGRHLQAARERGELEIANKAGALEGTRTDMGIVSKQAHRVAVVVMTDGSTDVSYSVEHDGERCIGAIAHAACRTWLDAP